MRFHSHAQTTPPAHVVIAAFMQRLSRIARIRARAETGR